MEITITEITEKTAKEFGQKSKSELKELLEKKIIVFKKEYGGNEYEVEIELINKKSNEIEIVVSAWPVSSEKQIVKSTEGYYYKFKTSE